MKHWHDCNFMEYQESVNCVGLFCLLIAWQQGRISVKSEFSWFFFKWKPQGATLSWPLSLWGWKQRAMTYQHSAAVPLCIITIAFTVDLLTALSARVYISQLPFAIFSILTHKILLLCSKMLLRFLEALLWYRGKGKILSEALLIQRFCVCECWSLYGGSGFDSCSVFTNRFEIIWICFLHTLKENQIQTILSCVSWKTTTKISYKSVRKGQKRADLKKTCFAVLFLNSLNVLCLLFFPSSFMVTSCTPVFFSCILAFFSLGCFLLSCSSPFFTAEHEASEGEQHPRSWWQGGAIIFSIFIYSNGSHQFVEICSGH